MITCFRRQKELSPFPIYPSTCILVLELSFMTSTSTLKLCHAGGKGRNQDTSHGYDESVIRIELARMELSMLRAEALVRCMISNGEVAISTVPLFSCLTYIGMILLLTKLKRIH